MLPKLQNTAWIIVPVVALAAAVAVSSYSQTFVVLGFAVANIAITAHRALALRRSTTLFQRPDGVLVLAISHAIAVLALLAPSEIGPLVLCAAGTIGAVGAVRVVLFRLGSRAKTFEREALILSAGIGVVYYIFMTRSSASIISGAALGVPTAIALTLALFSGGLLLWLATREGVDIKVQYPMLLVAQLLVVAEVVGYGRYTGGGITYILTLAGSMLPIAAYLHPQSPDVFAITTFSSSELNIRRSLGTFSVLLMGPCLITINELTDIGFSLGAITIGSSVLSIIVVSHLLSLVRQFAAVERQGQTDPLTGLPNRAVFFSRLATAIESARARNTKLAVMFLDLDRFKAVNDSFGHEKGDDLLRLVSERLCLAAEGADLDLTVARLGGDEFAIIVPSIRNDPHTHAIGRMFLDQFLQPFDMGLRDIYVTPSIGLAEFPRDGSSVEKLIENADTAMFEAKERGRNTIVAYQPEQRTPGAHRLDIEAGIHKALTNNELEVYYQPQIDIESGNIFAVEALLRWEHPTLGQISPDKFVPVAEESSLIDAIGFWSLEEACRTAASWGLAGLPEINVAVNLSPRQFHNSEVLTDNVARALASTGLDPSRLELELTESLALERPEEVNRTLVHFREMGIRTAIDDFGVGHTGLDYLDRITVDTLKIDRSFINRIGESGAPLVTAVISLAKGLHLDVIAEGVETIDQVNFLRQHGCRYMQGYLFSKPLTADQLHHVLHNQMKRNGNAYRAQHPAA